MLIAPRLIQGNGGMTAAVTLGVVVGASVRNDGRPERRCWRSRHSRPTTALGLLVDPLLPPYRPAVAAVHLYAQRALGYDAVQVGLVFLPLAFGTGLLSGGVSAIVAQRLVRESVLLLGWSSLALGWG